MEEGDEWLATDKLEHLLACLTITLLVSALFVRSRRPLLRRWGPALGPAAGLLAGAAKEAGDELGLWASAGASAKDAAADLLGVLLGSLSMALGRRLCHAARREPDRDRGLSLV